AYELKGSLQQIEPTVRGRARYRDVARQIGLIQHTSDAQSSRHHQAPEISQVVDTREHLEISLEEGRNVPVEPERAFLAVTQLMRGNRQSADGRRLAPVFLRYGLPGDERFPLGDRSVEQLGPDTGPAEPEALPPRQWP